MFSIKPDSFGGHAFPTDFHKVAELVAQTIELRHLIIEKIEVQFLEYLKWYENQKRTDV